VRKSFEQLRGEKLNVFEPICSGAKEHNRNLVFSEILLSCQHSIDSYECIELVPASVSNSPFLIPLQPRFETLRTRREEFSLRR
jgi:hypothetical protein